MPETHEQLETLWSISTTEYYEAGIKNEVTNVVCMDVYGQYYVERVRGRGIDRSITLIYRILKQYVNNTKDDGKYECQNDWSIIGSLSQRAGFYSQGREGITRTILVGNGRSGQDVSNERR